MYVSDALKKPNISLILPMYACTYITSSPNTLTAKYFDRRRNDDDDKTLNGRLPLEIGSDRHETWTKTRFRRSPTFHFSTNKKCLSTFVRHFGTLTAPQRSENARKCSGMIWKQSETFGNVRKCPKMFENVQKSLTISENHPSTSGNHVKTSET